MKLPINPRGDTCSNMTGVEDNRCYLPSYIASICILVFCLQSIGVIFFEFRKIGSISALGLGLLPLCVLALIQVTLRLGGFFVNFKETGFWSAVFLLYASCIGAVYFIGFATKPIWGTMASLGDVRAYINFDQAGLLYLKEVFLLNISLPILFIFFMVIYAALTKRCPLWMHTIISKIISGRLTLVLASLALVLASIFAPTKMINYSPLHNFFSKKHTSLLAAIKQKQSFEAEYLQTLSRLNVDPRPVFLITVDALRSDYALERQHMPRLNRLREIEPKPYFGKINAICGISYCGLASIYSAETREAVNIYSGNIIDALKHIGYQTYFLLSGDHTNHHFLREIYRDDPTLFFDGTLTNNFSVNDDRLMFEGLKQIGSPKPNDFFHFHLMSAHFVGHRLNSGGLSQNERPFLYKLFGKHDKASYRQRYIEGVLQSDVFVDRIIEFISKEYSEHDPLVIITADHGELLGEGGKFGHHNEGILENELIDIPLVIIDYGATGDSDKNLAKLQGQEDIAPYILKTLEIPLPQRWQAEF